MSWRLPSAASQLAALVRKDFTLEAREKSNLWMLTAFTLASAVLTAAGAGYSESPGDTAAMALVLVSLFLSLFTGYAAFVREAATGSLDGLRAAPVDRWLIYLAKLLYVLAMTLPQLALFPLIVRAFTPGLEVAWGALAAWLGATSLALSAVTAFSSASLSFGEARAGPMVMVMLVLATPYLRVALDHLTTIMAGAYPPASGLAGLWLAALSFAGLTVALGGYVLE